MVQNPEEPNVFTAIPAGLNSGADPHDVPFGQFTRARNLLTVADQGYMRHRDGSVAVTDRLFTYQFPILDTRLPWIVPFTPPIDPTEGELTLVAFPNRDLEASAGSPLSITFIVSGGSDLGITTFEWDFSFDGVTFNIESSGSSTSQVNIFTTGGSFVIRVRGTGSDTRQYTAEVTLDIGDADNPDPPIPPIDDIPPEEPPPDPVDQVLPTVTVTVTPDTIGLGESAEVSWFTTDGDSFIFYFPDGSTESVASSGTKVVTPTATGTQVFVVDAFNTAGFGTGSATLTINPAVTDPTAGWLFMQLQQVRKHLESFDIPVEAREEDGQGLASYPNAVLPLLVTFGFDEAVSAALDATAAFNVGKTIATFSGNQIALPSGINISRGQLKAFVPDVALTPAIAAVTVYRQLADFKVEVVDVTGTAFPSNRIETTLNVDFVEATFYLKITAQEPGTATIKTDFDRDGLVTGTGFEGIPAEPNFDRLFVSHVVTPAYDPSVEIAVATEFINNQEHFVIPGNAWQKGTDKGIVMMKLDIFFFKQEGNVAGKPHFVGVEFECRERLSTE